MHAGFSNRIFMHTGNITPLASCRPFSLCAISICVSILELIEYDEGFPVFFLCFASTTMLNSITYVGSPYTDLDCHSMNCTVYGYRILVLAEEFVQLYYTDMTSCTDVHFNPQQKKKAQIIF